MMKRIFFTFFVFLFIFACFSFASAQSTVEINYFYRPKCPHCLRVSVFLDDLGKKYNNIEIKKYNVFERGGIEKLLEFYDEYDVPEGPERGLVPVIFTPDRYFVGFDEMVAKEIEGCIEHCILGETGEQEIKNAIALPFIGEIDPSQYSLPVLAVVLGFFDGFNVCSLGALVLILGLVLVLKSRKKMLAFGGIFILTTAIVYGLLIFLWYQVFSFFVGYLRAMEILIGLLGVFGGYYFLKEFLRYRKQGPVCEKGSGGGIVQRFSFKIKQKFESGGSILALLGAILFFSGIITIVEFPCSAAVPVFFAGALAKHGLSSFRYILYISLFLIFYMLDEIVVFLVAVFTMTIKLASKKFVIWVTLVESIVLFLLGFYYLFGFLIFH